MVTLQNVQYVGLLDLAHAQGLKAIRTRLLQVPSDGKGQTAVVAADVETERGTLTAIDDASRANVARAMLTCTIRLAETRAKARVLRDADNVRVAALEELGNIDQNDKLEEGPRGYEGEETRPVTRHPTLITATSVSPASSNGELATTPQRTVVAKLTKAAGVLIDLETFTSTETRSLILQLQRTQLNRGIAAAGAIDEANTEDPGTLPWPGSSAEKTLATPSGPTSRKSVALKRVGKDPGWPRLTPQRQ